MGQTEPQQARGRDAPGATRQYVLLAAVLVCLPTALALFARWSWVCDLFTHYRAYYVAILIPCGLLLLIFRGLRIIAAGVLIVGLWNLVGIVPLYVPRAAPFDASLEDAKLRILLVNVNTRNRRYDLVNALIAREQPDLVLLLEVSSTWLVSLEDMLDPYPHRIERPLDDNFGIALYSRVPLEGQEIREFGPAEIPSVIARLTIDGRRVTLVGTHPPPPMSESRASLRNDQLRAVAKYLRQVGGDRVLLGDLNTTSWSPHFRDLVSESGLIDSRRGFGIQPTWTAMNGIIRLPIDHVLINPQTAVIDRRIGPYVGSDHRPVLVELSWQQ